MPTTLTEPIEKDPTFTFEQFVWRCANHCFTNGDVHLEAPFPRKVDFSDIYEMEKKREEALQAVEFFKRADKIDLQNERKKQSDQHARRRQEKLVKQGLYRGMLERVRAWNAPEELEDFRQTMIGQLETSLAQCEISQFDHPKDFTDDELRSALLAEHRHSLVFYTDQIAKARERIKTTSALISLLEKEIPEPEYPERF